MDKPKRDFHPGYAKRPNGCHHIPFTVRMWERWLEELNERPSEVRVMGIQQMRYALELRHWSPAVEEIGELRARSSQLEAEVAELEAELYAQKNGADSCRSQG